MSLVSIKQTTDANQIRASDPCASAWVSANAGTGKTYVLVQRVLRLLLSGTKPERILCLTFTKAAASEMANRLFKKLGQWAIESDQSLENELQGLLGKAASSDETKIARQLFARALETPGGLKVQTIHAFCERLLQRFPLESGIAPQFTVLDEETERDLKRKAIDQALTVAVSKSNSPLSKSLEAVVGFAGEERFDEILRAALDERSNLRIATGLQFEEEDAGTDAYLNRLKTHFAIKDATTTQSLSRDLADVLSDAEIDHLVPALRSGKKTDCQTAEYLARARQAQSLSLRCAAFSNAFLTKDNAPRSDKSFMTKAVSESHPEVADILAKARDRFYALIQELNALQLVHASAALIQFADAVMANYSAIKAARSVLDFDDLINEAGNLLKSSYASAWVLYKLDGGIDHILVDEAQDTNPEAWTVISALAEEFFSGEGSSEMERTVFAVGDEKQSIYSFQGADPKRFALAGKAFQRRAEQADRQWHRVPLNLSFRSTSPILDAVDLVFKDEKRVSAISAGEDSIQHFSFRDGQAGIVEVWETEKAEKTSDSDPWAPHSDPGQDDPISRLAAKIADQIKFWRDNQTILASRGDPIRPGDILILVRKREPFAAPMIKALKDRGIPVAGADRIRLTDQLAVMDLMALGDFLLMPEDDLALATVLKSPLIGLEEDELYTLAYDRSGSLWEALRRKASDNDALAEAYENLKFFLKRADLAPPFEFFAALLDWNDRRGQFIARLGPEAGDAIDEFLNMALKYDEMSPPSLQGFLDWMRLSGTEIKRDMEQERDEVRVMTVHGAKGLEAEIVFLADTCSTKGAQQSQAVLSLSTDDGIAEEERNLVWAIPAAKSLEAIKAARSLKKQKEDEEYQRLLYVGMTRAKDRLYISGFEGLRGRDERCWYELVMNGLGQVLRPVINELGHSVYRFETSQTQEPDQKEGRRLVTDSAIEAPAWAKQKAKAEAIATIPIVPSRLVAYEQDDEVEFDQTVLPPRELANKSRFLRGQLTHALLENLPNLDQAKWDEAADKLVAVRGSNLPEDLKKNIASETLAILRHPDFRTLFGPESAAEVPISAKIICQDKKDTPIHITGQIDRLAISPEDVIIVDYKTNRPPPLSPEDVAPAYIAQLTAYRLAMNEIFPDKLVRCAILWTDGPRIMEIPECILDTYTDNLPAIITRKS